MRSARSNVYRLLTCLVAGFSLVAGPGAHAAPAFPAAAPDTPPPNIILLVVDSLRADHVSAYGYPRPTTPAIDARIAARGARFNQAMSAGTWTAPSNASNLTGLTPTTLNLNFTNWWHAIHPEHTTLAEYLQAAGYATAGFVANGLVSGGMGFAQGFDVYDDSLGPRPHADSLADPLTTKVISWTHAYTGTQPVFLFVYFMDPHTWYNAPPPYDSLYDNSYTGTVTAEVFADGGAVYNGEIDPTERDIEHILALYDGEITYTDFYVAALLDHLESRHLLDNALIVVTSDHGEQFGEHGEWIHGNTVYEELTHVPLLMSWPGVITPGLVITAPVQSMDLMPTILDLIGLPVPAGLQATSLKPLLQGLPPVTRTVYSEVDKCTDPANWCYWFASRVDLRAARTGDWKLIHHVTHGADDELYRVQPVAPYEGENLITAEPERAAAMRQDLWNWFRLNQAYLPLLPFPD